MAGAQFNRRGTGVTGSKNCRLVQTLDLMPEEISRAPRASVHWHQVYERLSRVLITKCHQKKRLSFEFAAGGFSV
jgi:hypothetical protein